MSLIQEIHSQSPAVRYTLFGFASVITLSFVGFFWLRSVQADMFMAFHDDPQEQQEFLAQRDRNTPKPFAVLSRGIEAATASIGSLFGFDRSKGFDRPAQQDKVYLLELSK